MSDAICLKCHEPWDLYYLGHEALWEDPGAHAPQRFKEAHDALLAADDEHHHALVHGLSLPSGRHYAIGGEALTKAVLSGEGCPACWWDPARAHAREEISEDALLHNLFASGWDGDPAELL